jgi:two-component system NarL family response regulator
VHDIEAGDRLRVVVGETSPRPEALVGGPQLAAAGVDVVARASRYSDLALAIRGGSPDVVVLAAGLCAVDGEIPEALRGAFPLVPVVVVTAAYNDDELLRMLRGGVLGYLRHDMAPDSMARALFGILAGEPAIPRALVARVLDELRRLAPARSRLALPQAHLTEREWDVLELLVQGLHTNIIAQRLFISPVTVRSHVAAVMRKLGVRSRAAAISHVLRA